MAVDNGSMAVENGSMAGENGSMVVDNGSDNLWFLVLKFLKNIKIPIQHPPSTIHCL